MGRGLATLAPWRGWGRHTGPAWAAGQTPCQALGAWLDRPALADLGADSAAPPGSRPAGSPTTSWSASGGQQRPPQPGSQQPGPRGPSAWGTGVTPLPAALSELAGTGRGPELGPIRPEHQCAGRFWGPIPGPVPSGGRSQHAAGGPRSCLQPRGAALERPVGPRSRNRAAACACRNSACRGVTARSPGVFAASSPCPLPALLPSGFSWFLASSRARCVPRKLFPQ